jgi:hypothetical protein
MISPVIDFDDSKFQDGLRQLYAFSKKEFPEFIRQQAKLMVRDFIQATPPFSKNRMTGTFRDQKKVGEARVKRDIRKVWMPLKGFKGLRMIHDKRIATRIRQLGGIAGVNLIEMGEFGQDTAQFAGAAIGAGQAIGTANFLLTKVGLPRIVTTLDPSWHQTARTYRGSVTWPGRRGLVVQMDALNAYVKDIQSHVGKTKAGWNNTARHFGLEARYWPQWVQRHSTPGSTTDTTRGGSPQIFVTMRNAVAWADDFRHEEIKGYVIDYRTKGMAIDLAKFKTRIAEAWARRQARAGRARAARGATIRVGSFGGPTLVSSPRFIGSGRGFF